MAFISILFLDSHKVRQKYLKAMQNYSIALQTICKCIASGMQNDAKQRKAKKSKEKQIKQKQKNCLKVCV